MEKVLISVPGLGVLALAVDVYRQALAEGAVLIGAAVPADTANQEPALDAEQLAAVLSLPVSWIEAAAREQRIPSIQAGRWRRFKRSEVERALSSQTKSPPGAVGSGAPGNIGSTEGIGRNGIGRNGQHQRTALSTRTANRPPDAR